MKTSNATNTTWKRRRLGLVALLALAIVAFGGLRVGARGQLARATRRPCRGHEAPIARSGARR